MIGPADMESKDSTNSVRCVKCHTNYCCGRVFAIQSLFGHTYSGNSSVHTPRTRLRHTLLILYDLLMIVGLMGFEYYAVSEDVFNRLFRSSSKKMIMNFIFRLSGVAVFVEYFVTKMVTFVNGASIVNVVIEIGHLRPNSPNSLKSIIYIYAYMIIVCLLNAICFAVVFVEPNTSVVKFMREETSRFVFFLIQGSINGIIKSSVPILMMYTACTLRQHLNDIAETFDRNEPLKTHDLCAQILEIRSKISRLNSLLAMAVFAKIMINSINLSSCICVFADVFTKTTINWNSSMAIGYFGVSSLLDIGMCCYASQIVIYAVDRMCESIETRLVLAPDMLCDGEIKRLKVILGLKKSIRFNAMGLFDLKGLTILVVLNNVTNYAVILVQTEESEAGIKFS